MRVLTPEEREHFKSVCKWLNMGVITRVIDPKMSIELMKTFIDRSDIPEPVAMELYSEAVMETLEGKRL